MQLYHQIYLIISMNLKGEQSAAKEAINLIIQKGGESLYDCYISEKIPNHTHENIGKYTYRTLHGAYLEQPKKNSMRIQFQPKNIIIDKITPQKVEKRPKSQQSSFCRKLQIVKNLNKTQQKIDNKKLGSVTQRNQKYHRQQGFEKSKKPNFCFKLGCEKYDPITAKEEEQMRIKKNQRDNERKKQRQKQTKQNDQKSWRKRRLQYKIEELASLGMKYGYDDNGDLIVPTEKQMKQAKNSSRYRKVCNQNENPQKLFHLKYQTLNLASVNRYNNQEEYEVEGKKRGFVSSKFYKKLKMSDREYNNHNARQTTAIPFLNLSSGITLIEKEKNVTASKSRQPSIKRQQFLKESRTLSFKSYLPEDEKFTKSFNTISVDRPYTTAQCERGKKTAQTRSMQQSSDKKSILWRPQTTIQTCRLSINNIELAKQFVRQ